MANKMMMMMMMMKGWLAADLHWLSPGHQL